MTMILQSVEIEERKVRGAAFAQEARQDRQVGTSHFHPQKKLRTIPNRPKLKVN